MTSRERYLASLLFARPDKITFSPGGPRESTLAAWHAQGLLDDVDWMAHLCGLLDIEREVEPRLPAIDVSFKMIPEFDEKILEHRDGHYVVRDWMGAVTEISDEFDYTYIRSARDFVTRKWHKFPVETREDWENMKWRYDPAAPERHPGDLAARCQARRQGGGLIRLHFNGPFWQLREWLGMENLCVMMVDDPDFVQEMIDFWTEFVSGTMAPLLREVAPDQVGISEDMAYKAFSMISPAMVRRFLLPAYDRWVSEARRAGCRLVFMDSDGNVEELIPIWIEAGINCNGPVEVAAGKDIVAYREAFGERMAYTGGIDKRAIAVGGEVMKREVLRVVPPLLEQGGVIPGCDHGVPPDISWPNYVEYARLLAHLTGWL